MSVTTVTIKVPQDQKTLDTQAIPEYLKQLINRLDAIACGNSQAGSSIEVLDAGTYASGTFTIAAGNLSAADSVTVAGVSFAAVASGATGTQFNIGGSALLTATNLAAVINANATVNKYVIATVSGSTTGIVTLTARSPGALGNLVTLAKSAVNGTVSGAALAGGNATAPTIVLV